jgi:citrate synthase
MQAGDEVLGIVRSRTGIEPNVDFALAALSVGAGMRRDAGEAIFAIARSAGWIAHAIEEYREPPLRFRPVTRYVGR